FTITDTVASSQINPRTPRARPLAAVRSADPEERRRGGCWLVDVVLETAGRDRKNALQCPRERPRERREERTYGNDSFENVRVQPCLIIRRDRFRPGVMTRHQAR